MDSFTSRTSPASDREVLYRRIPPATAAAQLTAGEECPYLRNLFVLPGRSVLQLPAKLAPGGISDCFREVVVFQHAGNIEALNTDDVIFSDQVSCQLV